LPKVAFVVQRYGPDVIGGAESYCRQLAERLTHELKWSVTVYTTTAKDHTTWANFYAASEYELNGVKVIRFHSIVERIKFVFSCTNQILKFFWSIGKIFPSLKPLITPLEHIWFRIQGPWSPALIKSLKADASSYEKIFFVTYLYYPAIFGLDVATNKSILIPTAHDEPPFYSCLVKKMLLSAPKILALTEAEQTLIQNNLPEKHRSKVIYLGYGLDVRPPIKKEQEPNPYLLYLGRISSGKGVHELIRTFLAIRDEQNLNIQLSLAGKPDPNFPLPNHESIKMLGQVDESQKYELIERAMAIVNPSEHESLSMIVVEAMLLKRPVLVNTNSAVLKFYNDNAPSVFGFRDNDTLKSAIYHIYNETNRNGLTLAEKLNQTHAWATERFAWSSVLEKLSKCARDP
jgi:glycosyltransferase involved in cell wall biosynthesis